MTDQDILTTAGAASDEVGVIACKLAIARVRVTLDLDGDTVDPGLNLFYARVAKKRENRREWALGRACVGPSLAREISFSVLTEFQRWL